MKILEHVSADSAPESPRMPHWSLQRRLLEDLLGDLEQLVTFVAAAREVLPDTLVYKETVQGTDGPIHLASDQAAWLQEQESGPTSAKLSQGQQASDDCPTPAHRIFLIHGRDLARRESVARFLEKLGAEVVILQELPNEGLTIIEKLQRYANVDYAIALLTGDDQGGLRRRDQPPKVLVRRPRQNVLLELGYFLGRLGRRRVCILRDPDIEVPSDMHGVLTLPLDELDAWRWSLAKELKAAGLQLDLSRLL